MDQNPWDFIWGGFAFSEVSLTPQHQAEPNTPCNAEKRNAWWTFQLHMSTGETYQALSTSPKTLRLLALRYFLEMVVFQCFFLPKASDDKQQSQSPVWRHLLQINRFFKHCLSIYYTFSNTDVGNPPLSSCSWVGITEDQRLVSPLRKAVQH